MIRELVGPEVDPVALRSAKGDVFRLDITGLERLHGAPFRLGEKIKFEVYAETGLNVSIGIGSNRLVAKVGSEYAKPNGIAEIWPGYEAEFLAPMLVRDLPGIGPATADRLRGLSRLTLGDVARADPNLIQRVLGEYGVTLIERAQGVDETPVHGQGADPKSVSHETTFERDTRDRQYLEAVLSNLSQRVCARQIDFTEEPDRRKRDRLYQGIDAVRKKQGFGAIVAGRSIWLLPRN